MKQNYVYDLETYPNFFCGVFINESIEEVIEISGRKNDLDKLIKFYNPEHISYLIGFNNLKFDAQILQYLYNNYEKFKNLSAKELNQKIYDFAQLVIEKSNNKEFSPFPEWKIDVPQIDLYLINHYNNRNKSTSLKWIEYSINFPKVQDLPFKFNVNLAPQNYDSVIEYCKNDVQATRMFAKKCEALIKLRLSQHAEYPDLRLINKSDSSVGETMFLEFMSEEMNIDKKELKSQRTHRGSMLIADLLLPYISFKTPQLQTFFEYMKTCMTGNFEHSLNFNDLKIDFGEGGIHASWENKIFESDEEYIILDVDVTSYYPMTSIVNNFRPEHLGQYFSTLYKSIFEQRTKYPKGSPQNLSYKLLLNCVYGKLGDEYSFLFDHKPRLQICFNGQLLLMMLCERLSFIEDLTIIQMNTDGSTIRFKRKDEDKVREICKKWEILTGMTLEDAVYSKMVIRDVNNYIAQYENGKIKYKGIFEIDKDFHKNRSQRIIPIALSEYFINGVPIKDTIQNHLEGAKYDNIENQGIYDFCLGKKVKWNQTFVLLKGTAEEIIKEKVIRYYITTEKATMYKKYSDGRIEAVNKGYNAKLFQEYVEEDYNIDYNYYINEAFKITTPFDGGNEKIGYQTLLEL